MTERERELHALALEFLDAFNRNDLDAVMGFFSDDAVYEELHGKVNEGRDAIRTAFEPQFDGAFGEMKFIEDDTFIDDVGGKIMSSWFLELVLENEPMTLHGLDLLEFRGRELVRKQTFCKAKAPRYVAR